MKKKDPRITAETMSIREYLLTLLICNMLSAVLVRIYSVVHDRATGTSHNETIQEILPLIAVVGIYVIVSSLILSFIFVMWRRSIMQSRMDILRDAARRVAGGDYSIRIPPQRRDGYKDEFEVLYEDFNTMADKLSGKTILREDFLSNISHEFRTPLSVINNYITILQTDTLTPEQRQTYMERIRVSSDKLSEMVGNVLQISRLENNKIIASRHPFDLSEQLVQTILDHDQELNEKNIELETDFKDGIIVCSDEGLLRLVWNNLLSNSIKFTDGCGLIRLSVREKKDKTEVSVQDTGCGISEEDQKRIFEKFYQADCSHATKGNGLGLALVKDICVLLECEIRVRSVPGKGSTFTVSIPRRLPYGTDMPVPEHRSGRQIQ